MDLEERITDGCCLPFLIGSAMNCIYIIVIHDHNIQITLLELYEKALVRPLKPFLLRFKWMKIAHSS